MSTKLFITRHGETLWNLKKRMQSWSDSPLTDKGLEQAKLLSERLKDIEFDAIYSSSSNRAYLTAEIIKRDRDTFIHKFDSLREMNLGSWQGREYSEIEENDNERWDTFWNAPHLYDGDEGENFKDVQERIKKVLEKIVNMHESKNVCIVTHGVTLSVIMAYFDNKHFKDLWKIPLGQQTSLNIIEFKDNKFEIILRSDTSHL